jgi:pheromone shutdown protein TraB
VADDSNEPVLLTSALNEAEAGIIVGALAEEGIKAAMSGVYTAGFRAEAPGWVKVLVAERDLARAKQILAGARRDQDNIDWSRVDVGPPEDE